MTDKAITRFDPASYVDKVRDKIKQSLVDVIPDDQWDVMLRAEISSFFEKPKHAPYPSDFERIVSDVLEEETKKRVRELLVGPEWNAY